MVELALDYLDHTGLWLVELAVADFVAGVLHLEKSAEEILAEARDLDECFGLYSLV